MTRLFIRFYLGVLIVLFLAWYIHGRVTSIRSYADRARVITTAHTGGAKLVVEELSAADSLDERKRILGELQRQFFDYELEITPLKDLPRPARRELEGGAEVAFDDNSVVAILPGGTDVVRLGSFPNYVRQQIEASMAGWMRIAKSQIDEVPPYEKDSIVAKMQSEFAIPVALAGTQELTRSSLEKVESGNVAFYERNQSYYSAIQLANKESIVRFGPFPRFEDIEEKAATTTLALVLLPAAIAIAFLLRPVARQLRQLENAAQAIAAGDLSARVEEDRMKAAKPLANAFNHMAGRTESLVRTQRELLQAVSHELRTPLARMRFAIDLIETAQTDDERKLRLQSLDASTEELNALVGELLSYVRMETAEPRLHPEVIALNEMLDVLVSKYSGINPSIEFSYVDQDAEIVAWADRHGFQRAIGNLVSNAGRHAARRVTVHAATANGCTVIDVDDDGKGIPVADRQRVFEPFVRLNSSSETGVGLGLALVQRIVTQHGGTAEVLSSPSGGCRVRTTWPDRTS